jgi:hypothetical protein
MESSQKRVLKVMRAINPGVSPKTPPEEMARLLGPDGLVVVLAEVFTQAKPGRKPTRTAALERQLKSDYVRICRQNPGLKKEKDRIELLQKVPQWNGYTAGTLRRKVRDTIMGISPAAAKVLGEVDEVLEEIAARRSQIEGRSAKRRFKAKSRTPSRKAVRGLRRKARVKVVKKRHTHRKARVKRSSKPRRRR